MASQSNLAHIQQLSECLLTEEQVCWVSRYQRIKQYYMDEGVSMNTGLNSGTRGWTQWCRDKPYRTGWTQVCRDKDESGSTGL